MIFGKEIGLLEVVLFFFLLLALKDSVLIYLAYKLKSLREPANWQQYTHKIALGTLAAAPLLAAARFLPGYLATLIGAIYILTILFVSRKWLK